MSNLHEFIFGEPTPAVIGLFILAILLLVATLRGRGLVRLAPLAPALLAGLLLLADALVVTDREQIREVLAGSAEHVQARQWEQLEKLLTRDFQWRLAGSQMTSGRAETLQLADVLTSRARIEGVRPHDVIIAINGPAASVETAIRFTAPDGRGAESRWRLTLTQGKDGWKISSADMLTVNGQRLTDLPMLP